MAVRQDQCVDKGFGFKGFTLKKVSELLDRIKSNSPNVEEFNSYIKPIIDKISGKVTEVFDFALGDYTGSELQTLGDYHCDVIPYESDATLGTIALKISKLPCPADTTVSVCLNFSRCGSFSLAFNGGIPACIAASTGIGELLAPFLNSIQKVGFGFSLNNKIVQSYKIHIYDMGSNSFPEKEVVAKGNLYFTLGLSLADMIFPEKYKIKGKKLSEIFEITGTVNATIDFGKTFTNLKGIIQQARQGSRVTAKDVVKGFLQSGAEIAFALKAVIGFKLSILTGNFLPDINVANIDFNMLASLGGGNSGVGKGVYFNLNTKLTFLTSFYEGFRNTIGKIIEFFGIKFPDLNLDIGVKVAVAIQDEVLGVMLQGNLGPLGGSLTCLYRYVDDNLSCNGAKLLNPITIIKDGIQWVVRKAKAFFEKVGNEIRVAFDTAKKWVITNIIDPLDKFFKGKIPTSCPEGMENSVGLCYPKCQAGYSGFMTMCTQDCPSGYRNDGLFCFKPSAYGRGAGYAIWSEGKCNRENSQGCEKWGLIWYPRCRANFHNFGCCICSPNCPAGMTDIGISCAKKTYDRGVGKLPICAPDEDQITGLCHKKNPKRNYYKQYLKRMRFKLMHKKH